MKRRNKNYQSKESDKAYRDNWEQTFGIKEVKVSNEVMNKSAVEAVLNPVEFPNMGCPPEQVGTCEGCINTKCIEQLVAHNICLVCGETNCAEHKSGDYIGVIPASHYNEPAPKWFNWMLEKAIKIYEWFNK